VTLPYNPRTSLPPSQVNYNLLSVNAFMAVTGLYQLSRKIRHDMQQAPAEQQAAVAAAGGSS
jgi:hypothetical protein